MCYRSPISSNIIYSAIIYYVETLAFGPGFCRMVETCSATPDCSPASNLHCGGESGRNTSSSLRPDVSISAVHAFDGPAKPTSRVVISGSIYGPEDKQEYSASPMSSPSKSRRRKPRSKPVSICMRSSSCSAKRSQPPKPYPRDSYFFQPSVPSARASPCSAPRSKTKKEPESATAEQRSRSLQIRVTKLERRNHQLQQELEAERIARKKVVLRRAADMVYFAD